MNMQKFSIGLIVGIFLAMGAWYMFNSPRVEQPSLSSGSLLKAAPSTTPGMASGYGPKTPPHVTPPTTPPPAANGTGVPPIPASGIRGSVSIGPTCPVQRIPPDPQCADRPYAANLAIMDEKGNLVKTVWSDKNGIFEAMVPAGKYSIGPSPASSVLPRAEFQDVVVVSNAFTTITIQFDTGIR